MRRKNVGPLQAIPNVGKAIEKELVRLGVRVPEDLHGRDPYQMYEELCHLSGKRHDPCLCDVFMAAVSYMEGGPPQKWWEFTAERKQQL